MLGAAVAVLMGCSALDGPSAPDLDAPASVLALVAEQRDDFTPLEVEKKVRDGRVYYDIEGVLDDGSELEFDILMTKDGPKVVEIQRDIPWSAVPGDVKTITLDATKGSVPVRIIEGKQTDGSIIYEMFADGKPSEPAIEVRVENGVATLLEERWPH